jgi:hypothetical protein
MHARIRGVRCWTCGAGAVAARRGQERDSDDAWAGNSGDVRAEDIRSRGAWQEQGRRRSEQGRSAARAGKGCGQSRGGRRRPPEQGNLGNGRIKKRKKIKDTK